MLASARSDQLVVGHLGRALATVQGVRVVERPSVRARCDEHTVEQGALDLVGVGRVAGAQQQPPGHHHGPDRGAGLGVGAVRGQFEVVAELLILVVCTHAPGQVTATGDRTVVLGAHGLRELVVARLVGDIERRRRQVQRAHGVTAQHLGLAHGDVVEEVLAALEEGRRQTAAAAALDEDVRELEIPPLAGGTGELRERHLDLGVTAHRVASAGPNVVPQVVGHAARDRGECVVVPGAQARGRRLDEVSRRGQLVAPLEVRVAGRARPACPKLVFR